MQQPDPGIHVVFHPGIEARITLITGPPEVGTHLLLKDPEGSVRYHAIAPGESVAVSDQVSFTLRHLYTRAVQDLRPRVVPLARRERGVGRRFSMIRLEISKGDWSHSQWLTFNHYALPSEQYAIPRRTTYDSAELRLPDGSVVELIYSRERRPLPTPIALETFDLATHPGGYTGATITIRDFISQLRFKTDDGWSETVQMSSNRPASAGGFWYFQSTWDPPAQGYSGMNYTGIGVGNRNGVYIQLAGTCIAVAGMIFAFYIKPTIRRRIQKRTMMECAALESKRTPDDQMELIGAGSASAGDSDPSLALRARIGGAQSH
jgi:hypothetical protein